MAHRQGGSSSLYLQQLGSSYESTSMQQQQQQHNTDRSPSSRSPRINRAAIQDYSDIVEVHILKLVIVVPVDGDTTIADLQKDVVKEYQNLVNNKTPVRVKYVREYSTPSKRIMSSNLKILAHNVNRQLEIITEDWNEINVLLDPAELDERYRAFQLFAIKQVLSNVEALVQDSLERPMADMEPSPVLMGLLKDLQSSPSDEVKLILIKIFYIFQTKFPQRDIFNFSIVKLCDLIRATSNPHIVVSALKSLLMSKNSSQYYDIDKVTLAYIDINSVIDKMTDKHTDILQVFDHIKKRTPNTDNGIFEEGLVNRKADTTAGNVAIPVATSSLSIRNSKNNNSGNDSYENELTANSSRRGSNNNAYNDNEDVKYQIAEKMRKSSNGELKSTDRDSTNCSSSKAFLLSGLSVKKVCDLLISDDPSSRKFAMEKVIAYVPFDFCTDAQISTISASELGQLVTFLMRCLKKSLHARAASHPSVDGAAGLAMGSGLDGVSVLSDTSVSSAGNDGNKIKIKRADTDSRAVQSQGVDSRSTAEILITSALDSAKTDFITINNVMICILKLCEFFGSSMHGNTILECLTDYSKLLVTLSHAPITDFAETCAKLAAEVIAFQGGWVASGNKIDALAVSNFFICLEECLDNNESPQSTIIERVKLAFGYIAELASAMEEGSDNSSQEERLLEKILGCNDGNVLRWMWTLAIGQFKLPQKLQLQQRSDDQGSSSNESPLGSLFDSLSHRCLECISHVSTVLSVRQYLIARDAAGKLLLLLAERMDYLSKHMSENEGSAREENTVYVRRVIKTISNLTNGDERLSAQMRRVLSGEVRQRHDDVLSMVRAGNKGLAEVAAGDPVVGFYFNLLLAGEGYDYK